MFCSWLTFFYDYLWSKLHGSIPSRCYITFNKIYNIHRLGEINKKRRIVGFAFFMMVGMLWDYGSGSIMGFISRLRVEIVPVSMTWLGMDRG